MIILLLAAALAADPPKERPYGPPRVNRTEVALGAGFGFLWMDRGAWNKAFSSRGYATLGDLDITPLSVNGELYTNRHVPGFDYITYANIGGQEGAEPVATLQRYSITQLSYGYAVLNDEWFWFVPRIGAGLVDMAFTTQPTGKVRFDSAADSAAQSLTVSRQSMVLDVGFGIGTFIPFGKQGALGIHSGLRITLRAGAWVQLFDTGAWNANGQPVDGAPDLRLDGPYARIILSPSLVHRAPNPRFEDPEEYPLEAPDSGVPPTPLSTVEAEGPDEPAQSTVPAPTSGAATSTLAEPSDDTAESAAPEAPSEPADASE